MADIDTETSRAGTQLRTGDSLMSPQQRNASLIATLLLVLAGLYTLHEFLPALVWSLVFAIALSPLFQRLADRWPAHRRELLPAIFVFGIVIVFVVPVAMIAIPLAKDAHDASQWLQQAQKSGIPPPSLLGSLPEGQKLTALWQDKLSQPGQLAAMSSGALNGGAARLAGTVGKETVHRFVLLGFMLLSLFFLLRDSNSVVEQVRLGSRRAFGPAGEDVGRQIIRSVRGTVNGLVLVGLGEGLLLGVAYWIAGVPHPTLFGLMTGILAMVPFGAAAGFCIAGLALLGSGKTVAAIIIVVIGSIVTFTADHFIRPALIGGATRLPFIWVLLGILGGFTAWGLVGLFVGPATMAALILLWREWVGAQKGPINPLPGEMPDDQPKVAAPE